MSLGYFKDGRWVNVAPIQAQGSSQKPVVNRGLPMQDNTTTFALSWPGNLKYFWSVPVPYPVRIDQVGIYVQTGSAAATVRLAMYEPGDDGQPSGLLVDAGLIDASTAGQKLVTVSPSVVLDKGYVFCSMNPIGSPQIRGSNRLNWFMGWPTTTGDFWDNGRKTMRFVSDTAAYVDPFNYTISSTTTNVPWFWMRVSEVL